MNESASDLLTGIGLLLTLIGAVIAAKSVILKQTEALNIGVTRIAGDTDEANMELPHVQNLLASSRGARRGLIYIALGTSLQLLPVVARLWPPLTDWISNVFP